MCTYSYKFKIQNEVKNGFLNQSHLHTNQYLFLSYAIGIDTVRFPRYKEEIEEDSRLILDYGLQIL